MIVLFFQTIPQLLKAISLLVGSILPSGVIIQINSVTALIIIYRMLDKKTSLVILDVNVIIRNFCDQLLFSIPYGTDQAVFRIVLILSNDSIQNAISHYSLQEIFLFLFLIKHFHFPGGRDAYDPLISHKYKRFQFFRLRLRLFSLPGFFRLLRLRILRSCGAFRFLLFFRRLFLLSTSCKQQQGAKTV